MNRISQGSSSVKITNSGNFPLNDIAIYPIDENYLSSTLIDYYIPNNLQKGMHYPKLEGKDDIVWSLYSNEGTVDTNKNIDRFNVTSRNLTHSLKILENNFDNTKQIKLIMPKGIESVLSINGGDTIKLNTSVWANRYKSHTWRLLVRGM